MNGLQYRAVHHLHEWHIKNLTITGYFFYTKKYIYLITYLHLTHPNKGTPPICPRGIASMLSLIGRAVLRCLESDMRMDPLLVLALVIESKELEDNTHIGGALLRCVRRCADNNDDRRGMDSIIHSLLKEFRGIFYGTHLSGVR